MLLFFIGAVAFADAKMYVNAQREPFSSLYLSTRVSHHFAFSLNDFRGSRKLNDCSNACDHDKQNCLDSASGACFDATCYALEEKKCFNEYDLCTEACEAGGN